MVKNERDKNQTREIYSLSYAVGQGHTAIFSRVVSASVKCLILSLAYFHIFSARADPLLKGVQARVPLVLTRLKSPYILHFILVVLTLTFESATRSFLECIHTPCKRASRANFHFHSRLSSLLRLRSYCSLILVSSDSEPSRPVSV